MTTPEDITRHHVAPPPDEHSPWVEGYAPPPLEFEVEEYDAAWPGRYEELAVGIRGALGDRIVSLGHVGSTSVSGLPAKPVIDIDLVVADPSDEAAYIPALTELGYRHVVREPWWHEHRALRLADPAVILHVFGPDCPEVTRHRMFRDWLIEHEEDRREYADAKRAAAAAVHADGGTMMDYNAHKEPVLLGIYDRMFRARGLA